MDLSVIMRPAMLVALAMPIVHASLRGQHVERDPATGNYLLRYETPEGTAVVEVEARDRVDPSVRVSLSLTDGAVVYRYGLTNRPTVRARQSVIFLDVPCPREDRALEMGRPDGWRTSRDLVGAQMLCGFMGVDDQVAPGDSVVGFAVRSTWFPGVVVARVTGLTDPPFLVSGEETPAWVSDAVAALTSSGDAAIGTGCPSYGTQLSATRLR
jgi:hypothetical protein